MRWIWIATFLGGTSACSLIVDPELDSIVNTDGGVNTSDAGPLKAFGARCIRSEECADNVCYENRCSRDCSGGCPGDIAQCSGQGVCEFLTPPPIDQLSVGMLYVATAGDHGWTKTHDDARKFFVEALSLPEERAQFREFVTSGEAANKIDELVTGGSNVIIGTSFDFLDAIVRKSNQYPNVNFLLCSGFQTAPNLGSYFGRMYQVTYAAGFLAGKQTRTNRIGVVSPVIIPETVRLTNAFARGVQAANPAARVYNVWTAAWFDPPAEEAAMVELITIGADVLWGHTDTQTVIEKSKTYTTTTGPNLPANLRGLPVYSIGYDNPDSCKFGEVIVSGRTENRCLTSAYWNWGPMVTRLLRQMQDGAWRPDQVIWEQIKAVPAESVAQLAPLNEAVIESATRLDVGRIISELAAPGDAALRIPFRGPIRDANGTVRITDTESLTDQQMLNMCWFVEGIYNVDGSPGTVPSDCPGVP